MEKLFAVAFLVAASVARSSIYPDDHWVWSDGNAHKMAPGNFSNFITSNIEAGKTVFVRTIASDG